MPVYVYRNLTTDETFELKQSIKDAALKVHPETGDPVQRVIQPVGIAFKGSGFYVNDSKSKKSTTSSAKTDSASDTKADSKSDAKSETAAKPEGKTDSPKKAESKPAAKKAD